MKTFEEFSSEHGSRETQIVVPAFVSVPEMLRVAITREMFSAIQRDALASAVQLSKEYESAGASHGGEVAPDVTPEAKDKAFWNGYWCAAHNIAHDISEL